MNPVQHYYHLIFWHSQHTLDKYFNTVSYILSLFFYTVKMETSIQANGMAITKGKEKLTTQTELNIRDNGIEIIGVKIIS